MTITSATWHTRVRVYECDALGHVNNAVYLAYLQQATTEAWGELAPVFWELRRLTIEYLVPALSGDELEIMAWSQGMENGRPVCGYAIRRVTDQKPIARALAVWTWLDPQTHQPQSPISWPISVPDGCAPPKPLHLPPDRLGARSFRWQHTVRRYELDASGHVNPVEILRWIEETKFTASASVGWTVERLLEADSIIVQIRHDTEFFVPLTFGDPVEIISRIYDLRRVKGMWRHEVYRDGELVTLDYSSGAFLSRVGRPSPAPKAMLEALVKGAVPTVR